MIFYVSNNGSDSNDGLSLDTAFLTLEKAVSSMTEESTIYVDSGTYELPYLSYLASTNNKCTVRSISNELSDIPVIVCNGCDIHNYTAELDVYDMIFMPSDSFSRDTRMMSYSTCQTTVNFYNCVFKKSENGLYPTLTFFVGHTSSQTYPTNKSLYNCAFIGLSTNQTDCNTGVWNLYNCATSSNFYTGGATVYNNCIQNAEFNSSYKLTSEDNKTYGVYSGENAWRNIKCLLLSGGNYYSVKSEYYDQETKTYTPLSEITDDAKFSITSLMKNVTIGDETFKPIDKFNSFKICTDSKVSYTISGIKSLREMIIGKSSFSANIAENIDYFKLSNSDDNLGSIKMAFSIDDGTTWKSYDFINSEFIDLSVTIPNSDYSSFSSDDLTNWNNAMNEIYTNGIDATQLDTVDFNSLNIEKIKFAYVLSATSSTQLDKMKNLTWQFDAKGIMELCDSSEVGIGITVTGVKVTSKIDNDILRTNILYESED